MKCEYHPVFANRKGHTTLVVPIDDFDKRHNLIQLNIDKYIKTKGRSITVWHDGAITVCKGGAAKRKELTNFIKIHDHKLLSIDNIVQSGTFDTSKQITWEQDETKSFIERLIRYDLIRDEFRKYKKAVQVLNAASVPDSERRGRVEANSNSPGVLT